MREKFKKGEIVSATRTFNGEIVTGEFLGYHLFNDEIPDTVVGIVDVPGDGVYDVDVTSLRHCVKSTRYSDDEDERVRKELVEKISNLACGCFISQEQKQKFIAYLEKQKEQDKCPEYCVRSHCIGCSIYEKQKEKWPILEVFDFKVGDAVRLKDGDGRKHIIKSFEEVEGVHGPNFYHVEFEDNSARDGIYPGEEYSNGYYTQMEKFDEEQKPINESNMHEPTLDEARKWNEAYEKGYSLGYENGRNEQKPWEWGEEETKLLDSIIDDYEAAAKSFCGYDGKIGLLRAIRDGEYDLSKQEWSEEDMTKLRDVVRMIEDSGHVKSIREHYERFLNSLPERFNLQPKQEWSEEDSDNLERVDNYLWMLDSYVGDDCAMPQGKTDKIRENIQEVLSPWVKSLPERFNLQPKQEWSSEKPMDGLEEEMDKFFETMTVLEHENIFEDTFKNIARHFAQWQKSQMMKEAVEGTVHNFSSYKPHPTVLVDANGFNQGDKVRVIVIPNTDEK